MTRAQRRKRRMAIIGILSNMSRDWSRYTAADWGPLEAELRSLER